MKTLRAFATLAIVSLFLRCATLHAESQSNDYKGITDPFGDPANYEFAEDERDDKEFFHLGRYLMLGVDMGMAMFTGGLGRSTDPGFYIGGRLLYFFDRALAFEMAVHYSNHLDSIRSSSAQADIDTTMVPVTAGFRYYFDTREAPRAIAVANPYLNFGAGMYFRSQSVLSSNVNATDGSSSSFGAYGGGGVEFLVYKKNVYLGGDLRYHFVFFPDENETFARGGQPVLQEGDRAGDFFTATINITYNF